MPCFKGLAVSIHTPDGPLSEYSVQRQSKFSRISSYIPVPTPHTTDPATGRPEQSTFAISITLLTPGMDVPYSQPKPTKDDPYPQAKIVGVLPGTGERGIYTPSVGPYIPLTTSPNETIAAYIYFDGRTKEEVATLLRRGEETWVNSRWVGVPESEGGGLAEREFLFREVGLERWLNGLDLDGKDVAAQIERRRQKMERRRRKRKENVGSDDEKTNGKKDKKDVLRYGDDANSPVEDVSDNDNFSTTGSESDDDDPIPEAAGQIKVALFRVLASGEIKRGEYSPHFDAHDDEDGESQNGSSEANGGMSADADHTTSFAKPKTLDPQSISTQTVTGIDPSDKPYAVFTFFYRGERQLQKMGILKPAKSEKATTTAKRRSIQDNFASLGPLKKEGTVGFATFRDAQSRPKPRRNGQKKGGSGDEMDESESEDDDRDLPGMTMDDVEGKEGDQAASPEETERTGLLAEGVRKIKLKRQHSAEPVNPSTEPRKSTKSETPSTASTPKINNDDGDPSSTPPAATSAAFPGTLKTKTSLESTLDESYVGSPMKRQRASLPGFDDSDIRKRMTEQMGSIGGTASGGNSGMGILGPIGEILGAVSHSVQQPEPQPQKNPEDKADGNASGSAPKLQFGGPLKPKTEGDDDEEL